MSADPPYPQMGPHTYVQPPAPDPDETCHCGQPVVFGFDGDPTHHRGMCEHCDYVRCDAYGIDECGRANTPSSSQRVIHYPTGPNGEWWTAAGAHPGEKADCDRCNPAPDPDETPEAWRVTLTCCGHDDGHWDAPTWEEADAFREAYTSGVGVAEFGYSSTLADGPGHRRSGIVTRLTPAPIQPPAPDPDETCDRCGRHRPNGCLCHIPIPWAPAPDPDEACGARVATAHPLISQECALPVLHDGDHSPLHPAPVPPATTGGTDEAEGLAAALGDIRVAQARTADWWSSDEEHHLLIRVLRGECIPWAEGLLASNWLRERDLARAAALRADIARDIEAQIEVREYATGLNWKARDAYATAKHIAARIALGGTDE